MKNRQRLFLASAGLGALPCWLSSTSTTLRRAVLIPTAANPLPSAPFVEAAARLVGSQGAVVDRLDLEHSDRPGIERVLRDVQLVVVTGGYVMFLLEHVQRTGFDRVVPELVRSGRLAYVGVSAGAALAGPDLHCFGDVEDPGVVRSTAGLGMVPFTVLPHRDCGRAEIHDRRVARYSEHAFISIDDGQAVAVDGDAWTVIESPQRVRNARPVGVA